MAGMKPTDFDKRLGERLAAARAQRAFTQKQMAVAIGVSPAQFQKYEQGTNRISASALQVCARLLEVPPGYFFDADTNAGPIDLGGALLRTRAALQRLVADLSGAAA